MNEAQFQFEAAGEIIADLNEQITSLEEELVELETRVEAMELYIGDTLGDLRTLMEVPVCDLESVIDAIGIHLRRALGKCTEHFGNPLNDDKEAA